MAVAIMFSGIAAVALPLAQEFGVTREIDDRVMCPLPIAAVGIEKIVFSAIQSIIAAGVVFSAGLLHAQRQAACSRYECAVPGGCARPCQPARRSAWPVSSALPCSPSRSA